MHLCRPSRNGTNASMRSEGYGEFGRKRSGTNRSGSVKFRADRNVGYWFTEMKVYAVSVIRCHVVLLEELTLPGTYWP